MLDTLILFHILFCWSVAYRTSVSMTLKSKSYIEIKFDPNFSEYMIVYGEFLPFTQRNM
jgi:hypothetical protein